MSYWLRWVLVFPAALGAALATLILNFVFLKLYLALNIGLWVLFLFQMFHSFVMSYAFILAGAKTAPSHRFLTSLVLGFFNLTCIYIFTVLSFYYNAGFTVLNIFSCLMALAAAARACWGFYRKNKRVKPASPNPHGS